MSWAVDLERFILFFTMGSPLGFLRFWKDSLWVCIGFHWAFQTISQLMLTNRLGVLEPGVPSDMEVIGILFWFFPIVVGGGVVTWLVARSRKQRST